MASPISDNTPLSKEERSILSMELIQLAGPNPFLIAANKEFATPTMGREPVSDRYDAIRGEHPNSSKNSWLDELFRWLSDCDHWSRASLGRALVAAHRVPLARKLGVYQPTTTTTAHIPCEVSKQSQPQPQVFDADTNPLSFSEQLAYATDFLRRGKHVEIVVDLGTAFMDRDDIWLESPQWCSYSSQTERDRLMAVLKRVCGSGSWSRTRFAQVLAQHIKKNFFVQRGFCDGNVAL